MEMIRQGWAVAYRSFLEPEHADAYVGAEDEAEQAGRGIWAGEFIMPWDWRRGERLECER